MRCFFVQVLSELTTKDSGGWVPLMFACRSGNRFVFMAAMQAFVDRGEEGSRVVSEGWGGARVYVEFVGRVRGRGEDEGSRLVRSGVGPGCM